MGRFNGVESKYISNYLVIKSIFETDRDSIKNKKFIVKNNVSYNYPKVGNFKNRTPNFM